MKATFFLVLLIACTGSAFGQVSLKSTIESANKPITALMMKRDYPALKTAIKSGSAADFKYMEDGRTMTLETMFSQMKGGLSAFSKMVKVSSTIVSVNETGIAGTAVQKHTMEGMIVGADKKAQLMSFVGTSTEKYRKVGGKWLMTSMSMKTDKMTLNGKAMPVPMTAKG